MKFREFSLCTSILFAVCKYTKHSSTVPFWEGHLPSSVLAVGFPSPTDVHRPDGNTGLCIFLQRQFIWFVNASGL